MENKIDSYAYKSKIKKINPTLKVIVAFLTLLICIIADNIYVSLFIIVSMGFVTISKGKIKLYEYLSLMSIPMAFMILGSIAIAFGISKNPAGQYNLNLCGLYFYTSYLNIVKTIGIIMKALGSVSAMYMMTLSTNTSEIISVLRNLHLPNIIIELMNMIYRFIFILIDVQYKMKNSAQSRLGYIDFKTSCYSFGSTALNLLIISIKKANTYYNAMESRCYDGDMLFLEEEKPVKTIHVLLTFIYFFILILIWYIVK